MVAHTDSARYDKVHLQHFFLFVKDNVLILLFREVTRHQSECYIIQKLAVFVFLRIEKDSKVVENIVEQIVHYNSTLNRTRQSINEFVVLLHLIQSVVGPVILKVLVDLSVQ